MYMWLINFSIRLKYITQSRLKLYIYIFNASKYLLEYYTFPLLYRSREILKISLYIKSLHMNDKYVRTQNTKKITQNHSSQLNIYDLFINVSEFI
jgi:hypothetical protein